MHNDLILVIVIGAALAFDFTNGFHDTANVVATAISTRAVPPRIAVGVAALLNFVGAFVSFKVAAVVAKDIVDANIVTTTVVFAGLIGAITWNVATWFLGLPSSSSHALIGGIVGSVIAADGTHAVLAEGLVGKVLIPAIIAPVLAGLVAGIGILVTYRIVGRLRPGPAARGFRIGQIASGGLLALAHGTNDAQKTMGVMTLALVANHNLAPDAPVPVWVKITAASAIALGTYSGGWRIIKTVGTRIIKMDAAQGFSAQGAGATVILTASHFGYPLSTTHVINGGVIGAGAAKRISAVRWGVAGNIAAAWVLTLPAAAAVGAAVYGFTRLFGRGAAGPVIVSALILVGLVLVFLRRLQDSRVVTPRRRLMATIVDVPALLKVVWVSLAAGVGIILFFSLAVLGGVRGGDLRRTRGGGAALPYYALGAVAIAVCAWGVYRGYLFVVEKT